MAKQGYYEKELTVGDLVSTHKEYDKNYDEWRFLNAVYDGIREIIRKNLITKHERETKMGFQRRLKELFGFGYSKSVVDIFHLFLFKKSPTRTLGGLADDSFWKLFFRDANLYGQDYDSTIMEIALYAAVQGHMGILVDKASKTFKTKKEQLDAGVYPYIAKYHPAAILDWQWQRDEYNRPFLAYLKLEDDNEQFRLWFPDRWEIWELPKDDKGETDRDAVQEKAVFVDSGPNPVGIIPFLWFYNHRSRVLGIGSSDIHEVSRIDLSIIRNMSQIDETIYFGAFPMMRKPMRDAKPTEINAPQQDDEVGIDVVLEFDPENPESKPDWLNSEVAEPVRATLDSVEKKIAEIYRAANIGGLASTEPTATPQSGVAKIVDFQLLNSKIVSKGTNLEHAENKIIEFWLRWEGLWEQYKDTVLMSRSKSYDIEDLSAALEDALTSKTLVISAKFDELIQKQTARSVLPTATEKELEEIDKQIEENVNNPKKEVNTDEIDNPPTKESKEIINNGMTGIGSEEEDQIDINNPNE